jgi:hypothetical protein
MVSQLGEQLGLVVPGDPTSWRGVTSGRRGRAHLADGFPRRGVTFLGSRP